MTHSRGGNHRLLPSRPSGMATVPVPLLFVLAATTLLVLAATTSLFATSCGDPDGPADAIGGGDLVVYADGSEIRSSYYGVLLPNPYCVGSDCPSFTWQQGICSDTDDCTRVVLKDAPGIHNPGGTFGWKAASWGRYVFTTNYTAGLLVPSNTENQRIGVFDSETQRFCALELDPSGHRNGAVQTVSAGNPDDPQRSRIYFEGVVQGLVPDPGYSFGWIEAEASRDPCVPYDPASATDGWRVVGFTAAELNARSPADWPLEMLPCDPEGDFALACGWDGMTVLDPETVALGNWWRRSIVVVRAPLNYPADDVRVVDTHLLPLYRPSDQDNMCYGLAPVKEGQADPTRAPGDLRVNWSFDVHCNIPGDQLIQNNCAYEPRCALSLEPCEPIGDACDPFIFGNIALDQLCVADHPMERCERSGRPCQRGLSAFFPDDPYCDSDETCVCASGPKPAQEYRFDGERIEPVSPLFRLGPLATSGGAPAGPRPLFYDESGAWFGAIVRDGSPSAPHCLVIYGRDSTGEHRFFDPDVSDPGLGVEVVPSGPVDQVFATRHWHILQRILTGARLGRSAWTFGVAGGIEQLTLRGNRWEKTEASFVRSPTWLGSKVFDMNSGEPVSVPYPETGSRASGITAGGSPPSLWMHLGGGRVGQRWSAFLARMPVLTPIGDGAASEVAPAVAWTTREQGAGRMWLVGKPDAAIAFRVRDNGMWSAWNRLPPLPGRAADAVAAAAQRDEVSVFATGRAGRVFTTRLRQADCEPRRCRWTPFVPVPGSQTPFAPAAVFDPEGELRLVITRADGTVATQRSRNRRWSAARWETVVGVEATSAPSLTWVDSSPWVAVRDGEADVQVHTGDGWEVVRTCLERDDCTFEPDWCGGQWGTAPTISFDGENIRVFAGQAEWPNATCESVRTNNGWTPWRRIRTWARTINQPATARVGSEIHLVTQNLIGELTQQALE